ncbi:MAG: AMIN domain-containing protein [Desulfosudaceae bacterium]
MTKKKKTDQDARSGKDQAEQSDDLNDIMMTTDEDMEILEMTERTLVASDGENEETIDLDDNGDKAADPKASEDAPPDDQEQKISTEDVIEAGDDDPDLIADLELEVGDDSGEPVQTPPPSEPGSQVDEYVFVEPEKDEDTRTPELVEAEDMIEPEPEENGSPELEAGEGGKSSQGKSLIIIASLILLVLVIGTAAIIFFIPKQSGQSGAASSERVSQPMDTPPSETRSVSREMPSQKDEPETSLPSQAADQPEDGAADQATATAPVVKKENEQAIAPTSQNGSHTLRDIDVRASDENVRMRILSDHPTAEYTFFSLSDPARLVIDLMGSWNKPPFREKKMAIGSIRKIRLGEHKDKLRIVVDLSTRQAPSPDFTTSSEGLIMTIAD